MTSEVGLGLILSVLSGFIVYLLYTFYNVIADFAVCLSYEQVEPSIVAKVGSSQSKDGFTLNSLPGLCFSGVIVYFF